MKVFVEKEARKNSQDCAEIVTHTTPFFMMASETLSILIFFAGCTVLLGWALDIPVLKSILPGFVTMKANTALCFSLSGFALWLLQIKRLGNPFFRRLGRIFGLAVLGTGLLTLSEYLLGWDLGIDQFFFKELPRAVLTSTPGRMAFNTAIHFTIAGLALFLLASRTKDRCFAAQILMIPVGLVSVLVCVGYVYDAYPLILGPNFSTAMALHTVALFLALFFGIFFCRPGCGIMITVSSDAGGGKLIRWIFPFAALLPLILGWLKLQVEGLGMISNEFGGSFVAVGNLALMSLYIYALSFWINKADSVRKQTETYREMGSEIIKILNKPENFQDAIRDVLTVLKVRTGFDAVGMRLKDGDDFPYFVQEGFSKDFLLVENTLFRHGADGGACRDSNGHVSLECTCGLVISGKTDPSNPLFTKGGSFWTNNAFSLLGLPLDQDSWRHSRNQCMHQGYASMALIPLRMKDQIVGLLQFNDRKKGRFSFATIEQFESITAHIGEALMRKRAEDDLKAQAQELAAQAWGVQKANEGIKALYQELEKKNVNLEKLNQLKNDFVSIVAHELRSPLTVVREAAAIILDGLAGPVEEQQKVYLEMVRRTSDQLIHITNDLLDLAKIESGKIALNLEKIDFLSLARQSCEGIALRTQKKGIAISEDFPPGKLEISGDFDKLSQVMANLLSNAFKFTEKGGITVEIKDLGGEIRCAVKDTGSGISKGNLFRLFNKFEQFGKSTVPAEKGSGLGLVISKSIIEAHGGHMGVESELGKGSTFFFLLPKKHQRNQKIGEILMDQKILTPEQLAEALRKQNSQKHETGLEN